MKSILMFTAFAAAAWAGTCPAGVDPAQLLQQTPWAFQTTNSNPDVFEPAMVGVFRALPGGVLQVTATTQYSGRILRGAQSTGRYIVYPDCSGGELLLNSITFFGGSGGLQLEFTFAKNFTELLLVQDGSTDPVGGFALTGFAHRAPNGCPAGLTNPLNLLNGMQYAFRLYPGTANGSNSVGTISAAVTPAGGVLSGVETGITGGNFPGAGIPFRRNPIGGRYIMNADCSGGELLITGRPSYAGQLQLEFYFSSPDFSEIVLLNDYLNNTPVPIGPQFFTTPVAGIGRKVTATCPADAAQVLLRTPWAFQIAGNDDNRGLAVAVGTFRALPGGTLQITATTEVNKTVFRGGQYSGRYIVYPDCSGGELMFMINSMPVQLEFVYSDAFDEMYLVTDSVQTVEDIAGGVARRAPAACPAGLTNPLQLLSGVMWSFRTYTAQQEFNVGQIRDWSASVGMFTPFTLGSLGLLNGVETINNTSFRGGQVTRLAPISGRYQVYPDCTGGEIMLMNRGSASPLQLEFVYSSPNFDELLFMSDSVNDKDSSVVIGEAKNF